MVLPNWTTTLAWHRAHIPNVNLMAKYPNDVCALRFVWDGTTDYRTPEYRNVTAEFSHDALAIAGERPINRDDIITVLARLIVIHRNQVSREQSTASR